MIIIIQSEKNNHMELEDDDRLTLIKYLKLCEFITSVFSSPPPPVKILHTPPVPVSITPASEDSEVLS